MPNQTRIRICVVALTHNLCKDLTQKYSDLKALLDGAKEHYNVHEKGRVYGTSPDEWSPFTDKKSLFKSLKEIGFEVTSLSGHLTKADKLTESDESHLLKAVDLYIFDPLFLELDGNYASLIDQLKGAIYANDEKQFAIVIPKRVPEDLRNKLVQIRDQQLRILQKAYLGGRGEWEAEFDWRLISYLKRVYLLTEDRADVERLGEVSKVAQSRGTKHVAFAKSPKFGGG